MIIRVRADTRAAGPRRGRAKLHREERGLGGARPAAAHANFWLQIKIVPRGGEACDEGSKNEKRAGRWYFVLENLNSNPAEHAPGHTRV